METITSRQNPLMTHIRKLAGSAAYRRQTGECLCDSPKLLREAAQWGAEVQTVVSVEPWPEPLPEQPHLQRPEPDSPERSRRVLQPELLRVFAHARRPPRSATKPPQLQGFSSSS